MKRDVIYGKKQFMKKKNKPLLTNKNYERIFRIVHSVSESIGNTAGKSCLFYNIIGSSIIECILNKKAIPVLGAALFHVHTPSNSVLTLGELGNGVITSNNEAFHCWIQCEDHIIDFTAPVFHETLSKIDKSIKIERKIFIKKLSLMASSPENLKKEGDFFLVPNTHLASELLQRFANSAAAKDLANICMSWFKKYPHKIPNELLIGNDLGEKTNIRLNNFKLSTKW